MSLSSFDSALRCSRTADFRRSVSLNGTSILETVISITILLTVLTLTFISIDRINASVNPQSVYKAHLATNSIVSQEDLLAEEKSEYEIEGYLVKKQMMMLDSHVTHLILEVYNNSGNLLYTRELMLAHGINL